MAVAGRQRRHIAGRMAALRALCVVLSACFAALPVAGQDGSGSVHDRADYGEFTTETSRSTLFGLDQRASVELRLRGERYSARLIHHKEERHHSLWLVSDGDATHRVAGNRADVIARGAVMANLAANPDIVAEARETAAMLRRVLLVTSIYEISRFAVEVGSRIEGAVAAWAGSGGAQALTAVASRGGRKAAAGLISRRVGRELVKAVAAELGSFDIAVTSPAKLAALLKASVLSTARASLAQAADDLEEAVAYFESDDRADTVQASEAYRRYKRGMVNGLAGLQLWNDVQDPSGYLETAKIIAANFAEGAGIPVSEIAGSATLLRTAMGQGRLAEGISNYADNVELYSAPFDYYEGIELFRPELHLAGSAVPVDMAYASGFDASSTFIEDGRPEDTYAPRMAFDGRMETPWVEGAPDDGVGEWVEISFDRPVRIGAVEIVNGFSYRDYYRKNNRVARLGARCSPSGESFTLELEDDADGQAQSFPLSAVCSAVRFTILDIYPGWKYRDTCLGEVSFIRSATAAPAGPAAGQLSRWYKASITVRQFTEHLYLHLKDGGRFELIRSAAYGMIGEQEIRYRTGGSYRIRDRQIVIDGRPVFEISDGGKLTVDWRNAYHAFRFENDGRFGDDLLRVMRRQEAGEPSYRLDPHAFAPLPESEAPGAL